MLFWKASDVIQERIRCYLGKRSLLSGKESFKGVDVWESHLLDENTFVTRERIC